MRNKMVIGVLSILLTACTSNSSQEYNDRGYIVKVGDTAPELSLQLIDGNQLHTKEMPGKVVVLQFTASWCGVCRKEMPHLEEKVWQKFKDEPFILIGIYYDEPLETVRKFQKDMGTTYPMALDPNANIFGLFAHKKSGVTRNVVIDQNGKIAFLTRLFDEEEFNEMIEVIEDLLSESNQDTN